MKHFEFINNRQVSVHKWQHNLIRKKYFTVTEQEHIKVHESIKSKVGVKTSLKRLTKTST